MTCCICHGASLEPRFPREKWSYLLCKACGHAQLSPWESAQQLDEFYEESYFVNSSTGGYSNYVQDEALHRLNAKDRLKHVAAAGGKGGRLLDVGCAAGFFLDVAQHSTPAWDVIGMDCSAWARNTVREKFGITAYGSLAEVKEKESTPFQAVTMFQVLEHIPDAREALKEVAGLLADRGGLVIETWDRESLVARLFGNHWQQITPPSVLHLFSRRSLKQLVEECGFTDVKIRASGKRVSVGFVGNLLHKKYPRLLAPLGWLTSRAWIRDWSAIYALGDLVTLTARKA